MKVSSEDCANKSGETLADSSSEGGFTRRGFLKILGAGAAAAGASGCAPDKGEHIVARVKSDERQIPGVPVWYASTCGECSAGCGTLVKSVDGRVIKVEGNPLSPINKGKLCALGQSSLQHLYDPDRVRQPLKRVVDAVSNKPKFVPTTWAEAYKAVATNLKKGGRDNVFLSNELTGSKAQLINQWSQAGGLRHVTYDFMQPEALVQANQAVLGVADLPEFHFDRAEVVLSFGCDYLETWISPVEYAADWASRRKEHVGSKCIQVEPRLSLTGAKSDQWIKCKPGSEIDVVRLVIKKLLDAGVGGKLDAEVRQKVIEITRGIKLDAVVSSTNIDKEKLLLIVEALRSAHSSLVVAGVSSGSASNGVALLTAVQLLNLLLGNFSETDSDQATITFGRTRKSSSSFSDLLKLLADLKSGTVNTLIVHNANPVFSLPSSYEVKELMRKAGLVVALASHLDETALQADYILPVHTPLEDWGDSNVVTGVYSLSQPAMAPVFDTHPVGDVLLTLAESAGVLKTAELVGAGDTKDFYGYLKNSWRQLHARKSWPEEFEVFWRKALEDGVVAVSEQERIVFRAPSSGLFSKASSNKIWSKPVLSHRGSSANDLILLPFVHTKGYDGRASNRSWLQELPDTLSSIVWDSWAELHPTTAERFGVATGDPLTIRTHYGELNVPALVVHTVHPDVVAVPIGQGHEAYGRYAESVGGGNVLDLLPSASESSILSLMLTRVSITKARGSYNLVQLSGSPSQQGRQLARTKRVAANSHDHDGHGEHGHGANGHGANSHGANSHHEPKQMYHQRVHPLYEWGMTVDLAACTGCSACVVACYAENNIAVVGKRLCSKGREMSWLRIESYIDSAPEEDLEVNLLPMMCQHCNNAPCEPVCPVYATYHNEEGMNIMVYNRCVGTRYCSNNCSYKVRRFNWVEMEFPEPLDWQLNPYVTKRGAGVMEKCTFCVQRLHEAKDNAKDQGRLVQDGDVQPACVQSCPTSALTFGNLKDSKAAVTRKSKDERAYKILDHHLNTQPSVSYLENLKFEI